VPNVGVDLPFWGAEIALMQLSVPKIKQSGGAPKGWFRLNNTPNNNLYNN
jgi:hypothetical protein